MGDIFSVAMVFESTATSPVRFVDACREGIAKGGETIRGIRCACIYGLEVVVVDGAVHFHVHLKVTFVLE
jgi:flavin-binding protein dodecin